MLEERAYRQIMRIIRLYTMNGTITPENPLFFPENEHQLSLLEKHFQESLASQLNINLTEKRANKLRDITCVFAGFPGGYQQLKEHWEPEASNDHNNHFLSICEDAVSDGFSKLEITRKSDGYSLKFCEGGTNGSAIEKSITRDLLGNMAMNIEVIDELKKLLDISKSDNLKCYHIVETDMADRKVKLFIGLKFNSPSNCILVSVRIVIDNINIFTDICKSAWHNNATDIQIREDKDGYAVNFCVGGKYNFKSKKDSCSNVMQVDIIDNIKKMANIKKKQNIPQGTKIKTSFGDVEVVLTLSMYKTGHDMDSVNVKIERYFGFPILSIDELGITRLDTVKSMFEQKSGLILVAGTTGSGKTTTINALARYGMSRNDVSNDNVQVEEDVAHSSIYNKPIEFTYNDIKQSGEISDTFRNQLSKAMIQEPKVIIMGEIRTPESAKCAIKASQQVALVLATIFGSNIRNVKTYFQQLCGPDISSYMALTGMIHQQLVPGKNKERVLLSDCVPQKKLHNVPLGKDRIDGIYFDAIEKHKNGQVALKDMEILFGKDFVGK